MSESVSEKRRNYDSTVARIAGNIAAGLSPNGWLDGDDPISPEHIKDLAAGAVRLARAIVAEVKRTEPRASIPWQNEPDAVRRAVAGE